jgi:hypothetical protein
MGPKTCWAVARRFLGLSLSGDSALRYMSMNAPDQTLQTEPVTWLMQLDDGLYASSDDERIGPFKTKTEAMTAGAEKGWLMRWN